MKGTRFSLVTTDGRKLSFDRYTLQGDTLVIERKVIDIPYPVIVKVPSNKIKELYPHDQSKEKRTKVFLALAGIVGFVCLIRSLVDLSQMRVEL